MADFIRPTKKIEPELGAGIYFPRDVAQILKLNPRRVRYLMDTFWKEYTFGGKNNRAINFLSLIEFYTYYHLRERGFSSSYIKKFHLDLARNLHTQYPFATIRVVEPKTNKSKTSQSKIWYEYMGELMRNDRINQPTISEFIKPFLKQVEFGDDQIAKRFYPFRHTNNVVVDPLHQFGKPVINGTNLQTKTIFRLYDAGEAKKNICILYDISEKQVDDAIRLHERNVA